MRFKLILLFSVLFFTVQGKTHPDEVYRQRAESFFEKVWTMYRVPKYGLFSEYYPNSYKPNLTYFQDSTGKQTKEVSYLWPMSGVFSSVNILMEINPKKYKAYLDSMVTAVEYYYDTTRDPPGYQAYPGVFEYSDRYYDDNGLVGIDYIDAYNLTKNKKYLKKAEEVFTFIQSGWSDDFGGGVSWLEGVRDQKPACSNGKATVLVIKLYQATKDKKYLKESIKFYDWMMNTLEEKELNIIYNDISTVTGNLRRDFYTYNTGTMIQSSVRMYKITKDKKYLQNAQRLAEGSYNYFVKKMPNGVPYIADLPWFVVVLFRGYQELYEVDKNPKYVDAIIESADWAWKNARDEAGLIYNDWTGRNDEKIQPKWILDESCMVELYARIAILKGKKK